MFRRFILATLLLTAAPCHAQLSVIYDFDFDTPFAPPVRSTGVADGIVYGHTGLGGEREAVSYMFSMNIDGSNYRQRNTISEIGGYATPESGRGPLSIVNGRVYGSMLINEVFSADTSTLEGKQLSGGGYANWVNPVPVSAGQLAIGGGSGPTYGIKTLDVAGNVVNSLNFANSPVASIATTGTDIYAATLYSSFLGIDGLVAKVSANDFSQFETLVRLDFNVLSLAIEGSSLYGIGDGGVFRINTDGSGFQVLTTQVTGNRIVVHDNHIYGLTARYTSGEPIPETLFKIRTDGTDLETLHVFDDSPDRNIGINPDLVVIGSSLYGSTSEGGKNDQGFFYRYDLSTGTDDPNVVPEPSSIMTWLLLLASGCVANRLRSAAKSHSSRSTLQLKFVTPA